MINNPKFTVKVIGIPDTLELPKTEKAELVNPVIEDKDKNKWIDWETMKFAENWKKERSNFFPGPKNCENYLLGLDNEIKE